MRASNNDMTRKIVLKTFTLAALILAFIGVFSGCELFSDITRRGDHVPGRDTPLFVPATPTGVSATPGDGEILISWEPVTDADSYNIYWSNNVDLSTATGTKIEAATLPYTHSGLTNGSAYYYIVTAVNAMGEGPASAVTGATPQVVIPGAPTGVSASPSDSQVTITWSSVWGADSYNIYYRIGASGVTVANGTKIAGVVSPYPHAPLANGVTYYYIVTAVNAAGETASAEVNASPQLASLYSSASYRLGLTTLGGGIEDTSSASYTQRSRVAQSSGVDASTSANYKNQAGIFH